MDRGVAYVEHDMDKQVTARSVKMLVTITSYEDGQLRGRLDSELFEEPFEFSSLVRMIEMMETTFDTKGYPEKQLLPRTFGKAKKRMRKNELDLHAYMADLPTEQIATERTETEQIETEQIATESKPATCSFDISVRFRHNAEWQGQIYWTEKEETKKFASIVDMVKLIDQALAVTLESEALTDG